MRLLKLIAPWMAVVMAFAVVPVAASAQSRRARQHRRHHRAQQASTGSGGAALGSGTSTTATSPPPASATAGTMTTPTPPTGAVSPAAPGAVAPSSAAQPTVPGLVAQIIGGVAYAPAEAPLPVQEAIWAGDEIRTKPYIYGGGHQSFDSAGYDCSGSVSFVLHAAGLLDSPFDSSQFMSWGQRGAGQWITVYTNPGHAFIEIAGIRFDTSAEADPHPAHGSGPRWRPLYAHPRGFRARHPLGY